MMLMKIISRLTVFALLILGVMTMPLHAQKTGGLIEKNNVIFILVDDLGYGDLSCYNAQSPVKTVNIDKLAASGVMMTQAYSYPNSGSSRASFLTGYFPHNLGVYSNNDAINPGLGTHRESFVSEMKLNRYTTAWIGKWHQGWDITNHPMNNGFDKAYGFLGGTHNYLVADQGDHHRGGEYSNFAYVFDGFRPLKRINHLTTEFTSEAIEFMGQSREESPFFLYLAYNAPHSPYQAPAELINKYKVKGYSGIDAARYALIDHLDLHIGELMTYLKESGLDRKTLIVFTSDNGGEREMYNGALRGAKNSVWEGGIRVPMIASLAEEIPSGVSVNSLCSITDLTATFLEMATSKNNYMYGNSISLMPYFKGKYSRNVHDELLFANNLESKAYEQPTIDALNSVALRKDNWKLVIDNKEGVTALFDLSKDSKERCDLSLSHPEVVEELTQIIEDRLSRSKPASYPIVRMDTRRAGDIFKADSIRQHCVELIKTKLY